MCVHIVDVTTQLKILRLELAIIFIIDKSADYFLSYSINEFIVWEIVMHFPLFSSL